MQVAHQAIDLAEQMLLRANNNTWQDKGDRDPVTEVDLDIEQAVRRLLTELTPDIPVYGEEEGGGDPRKGTWWIVDPIDGTANFSLGSPWCGSMLALTEDGQSKIAICNLPFLGQRFHAVKGQGCFDSNSNNRLRASQERPLHQASIVIADLWHEQSRDELLDFQIHLMSKAFRYRVVGAMCMETQLILRGQAQGMVRPSTKIHDLAAPWLLLHEYGLGPYDPEAPETVKPLIEPGLHIFAPPELAKELAPLIN